MACRAYLCRFMMASLFAAGASALGSSAGADTVVGQGKTISISGAPGVTACATCHGAKGEGMAAAGFPYLAGQGEAYLTVQLHDFAKGERNNPIMVPIAKAMNPDQIKAVAAYYSQLPTVFDARELSGHVDTYPHKNAPGAWLANRGDWENNIPACIQCHGPGGIGVGTTFPALAGLPAKYIHEQLIAWKEKKRAPGPLALMGEIAARMNEAQMTAVADYFAALPASARTSSAQKQGAK